MKRALIYLFILALAANVMVFSVLYLSSPFIEQGQTNRQMVVVFLVAFLTAMTLTIALVLSIIRALMPSHKLPHLLIRDSLIDSSLLSLGCSGLLVLQLLRAATVVNIVLWLTIIIAGLWIVRSFQKAMSQPPDSVEPKRLPVLKRKKFK